MSKGMVITGRPTESNPEDVVQIDLKVDGWWTRIGEVPDARGFRRVRYQWCCTRCGEPWLREVCTGAFSCRMALGPCCGTPNLLPNYPGQTVEMLPAAILYAELAGKFLPELGWLNAVKEFREW